MPIYEYRCGSCGLEKEYLQKLSDAPIAVCPSCGQSTMTKLISAAGFQLKGSGWYATDFKGGPKRPAEKSDGAGESKTEATKTDTAKTDSAKSDGGSSSTKSDTAAPTPAAASGTN
jgi:putative FmdB family regulatory protein